MKRSDFSSPLFLLKLIASTMYILLGFLLLVKPDALPMLDAIWSRSLGAVLFVYGLFRAWRMRYEMRNGK